MGYVFRSSPYRGSTLLVHLAIADSVNDQNGYEFWMSLPKTGAKARVARSTVREAIIAFEQDGFLRCAERHSDRPSRYVFLFPETSVVYESRHTPPESGGGGPVVGGGAPESGGYRTQEEPKLEPKDLSLSPTPSASKRSLLFAALSEATDRDPKAMTKREARATAVAMESLLEVGAAPEEVMWRAANYRTHYPDAALTPHALVLHWSLCAQPKRSSSPGRETFQESLMLREEENRARQRSLSPGS